jgi:hypothetical protein
LRLSAFPFGNHAVRVAIQISRILGDFRVAASARLGSLGQRDSPDNLLGQSRRFLLYQDGAADARPLLNLQEGIATLDEQLIVGEPSRAPRLITLPVRLPLPSAEHQGSIHASQRAIGRRHFATPGIQYEALMSE